MWNSIKVGALALALSACTASLATAQGNQGLCGTVADLKKFLVEENSAEKMSQGMVNDTLMEMWVTEEGNWAFSLTYPDGSACIYVMGTDYQSAPYGEPI